MKNVDEWLTMYKYLHLASSNRLAKTSDSIFCKMVSCKKLFAGQYLLKKHYSTIWRHVLTKVSLLSRSISRAVSLFSRSVSLLSRSVSLLSCSVFWRSRSSRTRTCGSVGFMIFLLAEGPKTAIIKEGLSVSKEK